MVPRLKVFVSSDGLTDYVVAASSRANALAAWGSRQDLFKTGLAHETDDPELVKAAAASPGEVLRRPAATQSALAKLKNAKPSAARPAPKPTPKSPPGPSKAALRKIADLEEKLSQLDRAHQAEWERLAHERAALERRAAAMEAAHEAKRERLVAALSAARQAPGSPPRGSGRS